MDRRDYTIFSEGRIAGLTLSNRLVRSATWDPSLMNQQRVTSAVLDIYRKVALGGVGLIITGDFPVVPPEMFNDGTSQGRDYSFADIEIEGAFRLAEMVHRNAPDCRIVAQLETGSLYRSPSGVRSPFMSEGLPVFSTEEIKKIISCFAGAITRMKMLGFDGVQLHAAHGGTLSQFLSPYTNHRTGSYGGSVRNRVRVIREIVAGARARVGDYPMLIKVNGTDYVEGGIDVDTFPALAKELESTGVDAIEISGGMWDCLVRPASELGFRPVPAPESHTGIATPDKQSYFLPYAERLQLDIPVILAGGNRDIERLEAIVREGKVDLIALCRPLISEPDLPNRWLAGRGSPTTDCISCNACIYDLIVHPGTEKPGPVRCLFKEDKTHHALAHEWLSSWVEENTAH